MRRRNSARRNASTLGVRRKRMASSPPRTGRGVSPGPKTRSGAQGARSAASRRATASASASTPAPDTSSSSAQAPVGPAELVDRFLAVAHQHQRTLIEPLEQLELRAARVLELVDQQRADAGTLGLEGRRVAAQELAAPARQIVEVERAGARLGGAIPLARAGRDERQIAR